MGYKMSRLPTLQEFLEAEKKGRVSAHRQGHLVGFKYTNETIYAQDWDEVTLNARGIAFNELTGEVVARPFKKFFNYQEFFDGEGNHSSLYNKLPPEWLPNLKGPARYWEKLDGSLGIVFYNPFDKKWQVKTGGSFDSDQAKWGQKWYDNHYGNNYCFDTSKTYLYEIISPDDIHPIRYDYEGLVLLSIIENETGEEINPKVIEVSAEEFDVRFPKTYEFNNFAEAVEWAKKLPKTQEGLVITFDNGFKCKAKSDDWCQLARMFEGMTKWNVWVAYDCEKDMFHAHVDKHNGYKPVDDEVLFIPEELVEIREYANSIQETVKSKAEEILDMAKEISLSYPQRKDQYRFANEKMPQYTAAIMKALDYLGGKAPFTQVKQIVHKTLQPASGE